MYVISFTLTKRICVLIIINMLKKFKIDLTDSNIKYILIII